MKKITVILFIQFIYVLCFSQSKNGIYESYFAHSPILIDGCITDWSKDVSSLIYDKTTLTTYSMANDSNNIYISLRISDEFMQMKVLRSGITLSIDTVGKRRTSKQNSIFITYPVKVNTTNQQLSRGQRPNIDEIRRLFRNQPQQMQLEGFIAGNGFSLLQNPNGVIAKINWDKENMMIYELTIPFKSFLYIADLNIVNTQIFTFKAEFHAMERPSFNNQGNNSGGRPGGGRPGGTTGGKPGGSGRPGGGPPSWVNSSGAPESTVMFENQKFRLKFSLSKD